MTKYLFLFAGLLIIFPLQLRAQVTYFKQPVAAKGKTVVPVVYEDELKPVKTLAEVGILDLTKLTQLDEFVNNAVTKGAFPGCRVLAAKDGRIFYDKSFGYLNTDQKTPVAANTIYDLASVTKVVSTTLVVMRLYEQGKLNLEMTLGDYLPMTRNTDKAALRIKDLLLHQAGLKSWIPFYKSFLDSQGYQSPVAFSSNPTNDYNIEVAGGLYLRKDFRDTIWNMILASPLENKGKMVYSDLDFYFLAAVAEKITGKTIDLLASELFYTPMGLKTIGYNPLQFLKRENIAPTENDVTFRYQLLQGYVHDPGAALFGGVAGHAGVFGTAQDVAAIFQMLLNGGTYRGVRYFKRETVRLFTAYNSGISRRGLGFDKPNADKNDGGPAGNRCSGFTFGHQGFTGTCVWADPATDIVFVFLSNRICPSQDNSLINKMSIRTIVQDRLYDVLGIPQNFDRPLIQKEQLYNQ
jgi:beta-N-acetylhexosaminidase